MISFSTAEAASAVRSAPPATWSIALVMTSLAIEEVRQQRLAIAGEHRLGVELDALGGQAGVAQPHDHVAGARGDLQLAGEIGIDHERVVAAGHKRSFEALEDRPAVVLDLRGLAVDRLATDHAGPEGPRQRLVAQADAEHGRAALREAAHGL